MNILYTITRYWPAIGGAETHVRQVASLLASRHQVDILAHTNRQQVDPIRFSTVGAVEDGTYDDGRTRVHLLGATTGERMRMAPVVRLYQYPATKPIGYRLYASVFARKLSRLVEARKVDLIHNVLVGTEYLSALSEQVAHRHGLPFVITPLVHTGHWGDGAFFIQMYRRADAVVALLDAERQFYLDHHIPADRVFRIGVSPVIAEKYDGEQFREQHGIRGEVVLFIGRQVRDKGYRELLEAAPRVWARKPEVSFVFIGPCEESTEAFQRYADRRVYNIGTVSDAEKTSAIAACDVFCLPSISEILPTVFLEAWSFGKPVIGGDIPTLRELIADGEDGFVVRQAPEAIASAVLSLLDDNARARRMGEAGRQKVLQRYTPERVTEQLERLYVSLLSRKG